MGDPAGIGAETIAKTLKSPAVRRLARFVIIGNRAVYKRFSNTSAAAIFEVGNLSPHQVRFGKPSPLTALASLNYLKDAVLLLKKKKIGALVTAPVSKEGICDLGVKFQGHTEFIAEAFGVKKFGMMFVSKELRTIIVTRHLALKDVARALTTRDVYETISLTHQALRRHFGLRAPRIAVCGLNPHAGEGGKMGREEITTIIPAIQKARRQKIQISGPLAADTLFYPDKSKNFDCVVAMYHDQGLIPIKTLYFNQLVNFTVGLPFIRTSPAHGTAFDIAGKNKADPGSMIEAIKLAARLSR